MFQKLLLVGAGGGLGSIGRFLIGTWAQRFSPTFPIGTLTVNIVGSLAIGLLGVFVIGPAAAREEYRLALVVGVLGGFTTFSAFSWETMALLSAGQVGTAILNVMTSVMLGLGAVWLGMLAGRFISGVI